MFDIEIIGLIKLGIYMLPPFAICDDVIVLRLEIDKIYPEQYYKHHRDYCEKSDNLMYFS